MTVLAQSKQASVLLIWILFPYFQKKRTKKKQGMMIWVNEKRTEDRNRTHAGHPNPIARHARTVPPYSYPNLAYIADVKSRNPNPTMEHRHETVASAIECMSLWWTMCVKNTNPYQKQRAKWIHQWCMSAWLGRRSSLHQHKWCPMWRNKWGSNLIFAQKAHDIHSNPMQPMLGQQTSKQQPKREENWPWDHRC